MESICVFGIGNPMRGDDGAGYAVIEKLQNSEWLPEHIRLDFVGSDPLLILEKMEQFQKAIVVDAVDMGLQPGTVRMFTPEEVDMLVTSEHITSHGFGLSEALKMKDSLGMKTSIKILGIQPDGFSLEAGLSDTVEQGVEVMLDFIRKEVFEHVS